MLRALRVLIVEDCASDAELIVRELERAGFAPDWERVETEAEFVARLRPELEVILSDYVMPHFSGLGALELLRERGLEIPLILVSGTIGEETAVAAMKKGAADYLLKDRLTRLGPAIELALAQGRLARERKQAQAVLLESERRFREMLENLELIAIILDQTGTITFCNDYLLKVTGWSRQEALGADWFLKFVPGSSEMKERFIDTIGGGKEWAHYEHPIQTRGGQFRDIVWNNTMLRDGAGNILGTASIGEDVTARKHAEERVAEQAAMLNCAHDAIIVCGIHSARITFWNFGAERLYGWTAFEAEGRDLGALNFVDADALKAICAQLLKTGEWHGELKKMSKSARKLTVSSHATLVCDGHGHPKSALIINIDITEKKELEARFLRAQRMESLGALACGVAHDLNNILAPIVMSAPILRTDLTAEQHEAIVSTIEMSAERGTQIIRQMLTYGRGLEGERGPLKVTVVIKELMKIMEETFPKNLMIESSIDLDLWTVLGDATQLHQVLLNLCVNARDAMPDGGELKLQAANVELDSRILEEERPGPHVLLEVSDTGSGITPEILEHVFDPFFTTKGVGKGSGLGLSTVLGIVKNHGGFTRVETQPGKGTTFLIYLPASPDHEPAPAALPRLPVALGHGELVLVVDDEASVRRAARIVLETAGYRVLLASDGTAALTVFAMNSGNIALVLTDLMMPHMDGIPLVHTLRALAPGLPIIASTGLGDRAQLATLKSMNVETVLDKPYGGDTLLRAIHEALHPETV